MQVTNEVLAEFVSLNEEIKAKTRRLEEIKVVLKEAGPVITDDYICLIDRQTRVGLPGLAEVQAKIDKGTLEALGLIRTTIVDIVKVSRKLLA